MLSRRARHVGLDRLARITVVYVPESGERKAEPLVAGEKEMLPSCLQVGFKASVSIFVLFYVTFLP